MHKRGMGGWHVPHLRLATAGFYGWSPLTPPPCCCQHLWAVATTTTRVCGQSPLTAHHFPSPLPPSPESAGSPHSPLPPTNGVPPPVSSLGWIYATAHMPLPFCLTPIICVVPSKLFQLETCSVSSIPNCIILYASCQCCSFNFRSGVKPTKLSQNSHYFPESLIIRKL